MKKTAKSLTTSGVLTGICVLLLLLGNAVPNMQIAVAALAGLVPALAVLRCGYGWAAGVYAASGLLGLFLFPQNAAVFWFLLLFGFYGIVKSLAERIPGRAAVWAVKLAVFLAASFAMFFFFRAMFTASLPEISVWILIPAVVICLIAYDIAFSGLIKYYTMRIQPHLK